MSTNEGSKNTSNATPYRLLMGKFLLPAKILTVSVFGKAVIFMEVSGMATFRAGRFGGNTSAGYVYFCAEYGFELLSTGFMGIWAAECALLRLNPMDAASARSIMPS